MADNIDCMYPGCIWDSFDDDDCQFDFSGIEDDEELTALERIQSIASDKFKRGSSYEYNEDEREYAVLLLCRILQNGGPTVKQLEKDLAEVFKIIAELGELRSAKRTIIRHLPKAALLLYNVESDSQVFRKAVADHVLPIIINNLNDTDYTVVKLAQNAFFSILKARKMDAFDLEIRLCPNILALFTSKCSIGNLVELITLITKMAPFIGKDSMERVFMDKFVEMCSSPTAQLREACALEFGNFANGVSSKAIETTLLPKYIQMCEDESKNVRGACGQVLVVLSCVCTAEVRKEALTNVLIKLLNDEDTYVKAIAYQALGYFIATFANPPLLKTGYSTSTSELVLMDNNDAEVKIVYNRYTLEYPYISSDALFKNLSDDIYSQLFDDECNGNASSTSLTSTPKVYEDDLNSNLKDVVDNTVGCFGASLSSLLVAAANEDENKNSNVNVTNTNNNKKVEDNKENVDVNKNKNLDSNVIVLEPLSLSELKNGLGIGHKKNKKDKNGCISIVVEHCGDDDEDVDEGIGEEMKKKGGRVGGGGEVKCAIARLCNNSLSKKECADDDLDLYNNYNYWYISPELPLDPLLVYGNTTSPQTNTIDAFPKMNATYTLDESSDESLNTSISANIEEGEKSNEGQEQQQPQHTQDIVPQVLIDHYTQMADRQKMFMHNTLKFHCAFSFPAVVLTLGKDNFCLLKRTLYLLVGEGDCKIRRVIAKCLHELAHILGPDISTQFLLPVLHCLIMDNNDDEVRIGVLRNLATFLKLVNPKKRSKYLHLLTDVTVKNWRMRIELSEQLLMALPLFCLEDITKRVVKIATALLSDKVYVVRKSGVVLYNALIKHIVVNYSYSILIDILAKLAEKFAHSKKWRLRQTFILLCVEMITTEALSNEVFEQDLLPHLLDLAWDPVPNVRLVLARLLFGHLIHHPYFKTRQETLLNIYRKLESDQDPDVRDCADLSRIPRPRK